MFMYQKPNPKTVWFPRKLLEKKNSKNGSYPFVLIAQSELIRNGVQVFLHFSENLSHSCV